MLCHASVVGAAVREHHPLRHDFRLPAAVACDHTRESPTSVGDHQEPARVDELGLDLDQQKGPTAMMPSDQVDDTAFTEVVEGCFRPDFPARCHEHRGDPLFQRRVSTGDQALDPAPSPTRFDRQSDLEHRGDLAQRDKRHVIDVAAFDRRVQRSRYTSLAGNIELTPAETQSQPSKQAPDADVIHAPDRDPVRLSVSYRINRRPGRARRIGRSRGCRRTDRRG